ncbi:hypothetical protein [Streptomyces sp. SGAir0957]
MDGQQWLAACHPDPRQAQQEWEQPPYLAVFPCGAHFDVVCLPQPLALNLLWELGDEALSVPVLEYHLARRPVFYLLAEVGITAYLQPLDEEAAVLTAGDVLPAPSPQAQTSGVRHHSRMWRTAPDGSGHLATADNLQSAYRRACDKERQAARVRSARTVFWGARHTRPGRGG